MKLTEINEDLGALAAFGRGLIGAKSPSRNSSFVAQFVTDVHQKLVGAIARGDVVPGLKQSPTQAAPKQAAPVAPDMATVPPERTDYSTPKIDDKVLATTGKTPDAAPTSPPVAPVAPKPTETYSEPIGLPNSPQYVKGPAGWVDAKTKKVAAPPEILKILDQALAMVKKERESLSEHYTKLNRVFEQILKEGQAMSISEFLVRYVEKELKPMKLDPTSVTQLQKLASDAESLYGKPGMKGVLTQIGTLVHTLASTALKNQQPLR